MGAGTLDDEVLAPDEVAAAIEALKDADLTRLAKIAKWYIKQKPPWINQNEYLELVDEAVSRLMDGTRKCPRSVGIVQALRGIMRSIVSDEIKKWLREHGEPSARLRTVDGENVPEPIQYRSPTLDPEQQLIRQEEVAEQLRKRIEILRLFKDKLPVQKILEGMLNGLRGEALQEWSGLGDKEYASARRMIRRRLEQHDFRLKSKQKV
jgi:hypothetical protein